MSSSATSFVSSLLSTERFVTMKIKLAKTAVKSAIASMIVPSSATLQQTSSVVCAVMLATWLEIAQIDSVVLIGATGLHPQEACLADQDQQLAELVVVMSSTVRWR
jgi:hypothetical protein